MHAIYNEQMPEEPGKITANPFEVPHCRCILVATIKTIANLQHPKTANIASDPYIIKGSAAA